MSLFNGRYSSPRKADGSINSGGKVYFYETGTSTLKSVYQDEALTTAHTNPVILDSNGTALIFLASGSYDYKVDTSDDTALVTTQGPINGGAVVSDPSTISSDVSWTVDGVGAGDTEYATLEAALDDSRNYSILPSGSLTINVSSGTFIESALDWRHQNGNRITVTGDSRATTTIKRQTNVNMSLVELDAGYIFGEISEITFDDSATYSSANATIHLTEGASILNLTNIGVDGRAGHSNRALYMESGSSVPFAYGLYFDINHIDIRDRSFLHATICQHTNPIASTNGLYVIDDAYVYASAFSFDGDSGAAYTDAVFVRNAKVYFPTTLSVDYANNGVAADNGGVVRMTDGSATFTNITTANYDPAKNTIKSTTGGSADLAIIYA